MKKLMFALALAALSAGCSTASLSLPGSLQGIDIKGADGKAMRTLCIGNEGYFLCNQWPIFAGDMDWDDEENGIDLWSMAWFRDQTDAQTLTDTFYRYADHLNCDVVDIVVHQKTDYPIGVSGIPAWISNFFSTHELYVTGVLKPRNK